ncbi:hypothetical protein J8273_0366 [Carpediemonas membranifera]|uniref:Uncharacterized protein n=1 Tax=Carpediemonas membranifera TaxID=201153 RepID=A0A8J6B8U4_9EUKA|nr:hypothetical protein J8273_0366 [Carpediemonas membranifera]|eukprot:KAG9395147.1 hypothetical protein J8273_0366 [Carpediemonas membranifera]
MKGHVTIPDCRHFEILSIFIDRKLPKELVIDATLPRARIVVRGAVAVVTSATPVRTDALLHDLRLFFQLRRVVRSIQCNDLRSAELELGPLVAVREGVSGHACIAITVESLETVLVTLLCRGCCPSSLKVCLTHPECVVTVDGASNTQVEPPRPLVQAMLDRFETLWTAVRLFLTDPRPAVLKHVATKPCLPRSFTMTLSRPMTTVQLTVGWVFESTRPDTEVRAMLYDVNSVRQSIKRARLADDLTQVRVSPGTHFLRPDISLLETYVALFELRGSIPGEFAVTVFDPCLVCFSLTGSGVFIIEPSASPTLLSLVNRANRVTLRTPGLPQTELAAVLDANDKTAVRLIPARADPPYDVLDLIRVLSSMTVDQPRTFIMALGQPRVVVELDVNRVLVTSNRQSSTVNQLVDVNNDKMRRMLRRQLKPRRRKIQWGARIREPQQE